MAGILEAAELGGLAVGGIACIRCGATTAVMEHSQSQHAAADQEQRFRLWSWHNGGWRGFVHVVTGGGQGYCTVLGGKKDLRHPYRRRCVRTAIAREMVFR